MIASLSKGVRAFGMFWWDFLVGDTPDMFFATVAIVALAFLLRHHRVVAIIVVPAVAIVALFVSAYRGRRRASNASTTSATPE